MISNDEARSSPLKLYTMGIATQPADVVGVIGGQAVFTVAFVGGAASYQWQVKVGAEPWTNMVETAGVYEGTTTATLTVKALDNFLAQLTAPLLFRCVGYKSALPLPTFTSSAELTIPISAGWGPDLIGYGQQIPGGDCFVTNFPFALNVTGITPPYDFAWSRVSGSTDIVSLTPTAFYPNLFCPNLLATQIAFWRVLISKTGDPTQHVLSDAMPVVAQLGEPSYNGAIPYQSLTSDGGAVQPVVDLPYWIGPYLVAYQQKIRRSAFPTIAMIDPTDLETAFTFSGATPPVSADVISIAGVLNFDQQPPVRDPSHLYYYVTGSSWQRGSNV